MPDSVATRPDHPDPALRTRYYDVPFATVWEAARETLGSVPGTRLVGEDVASGSLVGVHTSPFLRVRDTVALQVEECETGEIEVGATGTRARSLQDVLAALDARLRRTYSGQDPA